MKLRLLIVTLLVIALAVPAAMLAQGSKAEQEVQASLAQLRKANLMGGVEAATIFDKYLADNFMRIPANGAVFTKTDVLDDFRAGKQKAETLEMSDVKIRVNGKTAVVTGIVNSTSAGRLSGSNTLQARQFRFTRVFVKNNGIWQCVLYQSTLIRGKEEAMK